MKALVQRANGIVYHRPMLFARCQLSSVSISSISIEIYFFMHLLFTGQIFSGAEKIWFAGDEDGSSRGLLLRARQANIESLRFRG